MDPLTIPSADILALPMQQNDAAAETIKDYLIALLSTLWQEEEGFSGKRPFGNSGWQHDIYEALGKAEVIEVEWGSLADGTTFYDGLDRANRAKADQLIDKVIKDL